MGIEGRCNALERVLSHVDSTITRNREVWPASAGASSLSLGVLIKNNEAEGPHTWAVRFGKEQHSPRHSADASRSACTPAPVPTTTTTVAPGVDCTAREPGVDLHICDLSYTNLTGADLNRAILTSADLTDAEMTNATLYGATLYDANLTNANLTGVIWQDTICPNGVVQSTECPRTVAG